MKEKACTQCSRLAPSEICAVCKAPTSPNWVGYVSILDPEKSEVAKKLNIATKGRYALRVR
ncbi:MAG: transcription elongation factor subunit Spt4 [Candidatus Hydrothermarchaeota archaeon]|nr:DNA-directed RNA polymerase subunit E'' [Euryarchaeota archaeon]